MSNPCQSSPGKRLSWGKATGQEEVGTQPQGAFHALGRKFESCRGASLRPPIGRTSVPGGARLGHRRAACGVAAALVSTAPGRRNLRDLPACRARTSRGRADAGKTPAHP